MKTMKKIFALALAMMMVFSLALSANAATPMPTTGTVTINGAAAGTEYSFYRVYDLESVKVDGETVSPIYITNTTWGDFGTATDPVYVSITDDGYVTGTSSFTTATAQEFAASAMTYAETAEPKINANKIVTAEDSGALPVTELQYGFYVVKSNRVLPTGASQTQYAVFTLYEGTDSINEKNNTNLPEFAKTVLEDSTVTNDNPNGTFGDTNDADIGQTMTFKLTVTAAAGTDAYTITDTMTNMEYENITGVTLNNNAITTGFTVEATQGGSTFTVTFDEDFRKSLKDNDVIEITYTAKLTDGAVIDGAGNPNDATLTFGDETKTDSTTTKTYQITVKKTDDKNPATVLPGATFVLKKGNQFYSYSETSGVIWVNDQANATPMASGADGVLVFKGIDADNYTLVETDAPEGYVLPTTGEDVIVGENKEVTITNTLGEALPETGGMGTTLLYTMGGLMVTAAVVLLATKKRMSSM